MEQAPKSPRADRGAAVLLSRTSRAILLFWALLALAALAPTPLRGLLVRDGASEPSPGRAPGPRLGGGVEPGPAPSPRSATGRTPTSPPVPPKGSPLLEDPAGSLGSFRAALARVSSKAPGAVARVLHYGDSLLDLDYISGHLRTRFQRRYGDAGHGFVLAGRPWRWYAQFGVTVAESGSGWDHHRLVGGPPRDGRLGLGCAAIQSTGAGPASTEIVSSARASRLGVHFLATPRGGTFDLLVDGRPVRSVSTAAASPASGSVEVAVPDGPHRIKLRARGGPVRLFGLTLDREGPGITWENLPLVSARFHNLTGLSEAHWAEQLRARRPDLVLFQFGANDTISFGGNLVLYGRKVEAVLARLRRALPSTSCLVIGPLDRLERGSDGGLHSPQVVRTVSAEQRRAALATGCAFFDGQSAMGGPGSMRSWLDRNLAIKDMVHLTREGSDLFAARLEQALVAALEARGGAGSARGP
jgi:lysophospholipase L1-like esterase